MPKEKEREAWTKTINVYREFSHLWDKKNYKYFNRGMRQDGYKILLQVYNEEVGKDITMADFKRKMENMRTTYGREQKKVNASRQNGSDSSELYVPALWYYPLFNFLEGSTEPCRAESDTLDEYCVSPELPSASVEDVNGKEVRDGEKKIKLSKTQKILFQNKQKNLMNTAQALMSQQERDWEIIGKSIGIQLRNLSEHQQVIVQKIISDALFYGKLGKLTDESMITL